MWNLFVNALNGATSSVVGNAGIVKKVYFPREILPLSSVGASIVHYLLQVCVLIVMLVVFQHNIDWSVIWLLPLSLVTLIIFVASLGILLSAVNVYARDMQHLLELILLAWFWITPVVYFSRKLPTEGFVGIIGSIIRANPMSAVILPFQRVIYREQIVTSTVDNKTMIQILPDESTLWYLKNLGITLGFSLILFFFAMRFFDSAQGNFAEEL